MPTLPPVGATATLEGYDLFSKELAQMQRDLLQLGKDAASASKPVEDLGKSIGKLPTAAGKTGKALSQTGDGAREAGQGIGIADIALGSFISNLATQAIGAVVNFGSNVASMGVEMTRTAARADELRIVAQYVGASYGQTTAQVDEQIKSIQAAGIRYDQAARAVVDMTEAQLDMSKSSDLVKIAQASAIKSGQDSSATLQQIIYGIRTLQPEMLRTAGITTSLDEAMAGYTDEAGNHIKAVTGQQKQQALFNSVLQKGSGLLGLYDVAMMEPEKRLRSLDRITYEISRTMGSVFKPTFGDAVGVMEYFTKSILKAVSDGGQLHDLLVNVGATAGVFSENLAGMAKSAVDTGLSLASGLGDSLAGVAENALTWGINVMTEFADGLITGAANALTAAMDFIGGLLSSWLSAGSPPKVAPDIGAWGASAMSEYLKGFGEADFTALDAVQGPLKSILDLTGQAGDFTGLTMNLTAALAEFSKTGQVTGDIFQRLSQVGGMYGTELEKLARLQFDLIASSKTSEKADTDYAVAQEEVNKLTEEYNSLLENQPQVSTAKTGLVGGYDKGRYKVRAYAAPAAVAPGLEAKKRLLDEAKARLSAADVARKAAKEQEDNLKRQVTLQDRLLKQLLEIAQVQEKLAKESKKAAAKTEKKPVVAKAKAGGAGTPTVKAGGVTIPKIGSLINTELDKAKAAISAKLGELFAPLAAKWEESIKPTLDRLVSKFEWFKGIVVESWKKLEKELQPVIDFFKTLIPPDVAKQLGEFAGVLLVIGVAAGILVGVGAIILAIVTPVTLLIAGIAALYVLIRNQGPKIVASWKANWEMLKIIVTNTWKNVVARVTAIRDGVVNKFKEIRKGVEDAILSVRDGVVGKFTEIKTSVEGAVASVREAIVSKFEGARAGVSNAIAAIRDGVTSKFEEVKASISDALNSILASFGITEEIKTRWAKIWDDVKLIAETLLAKVRAAIEGKLAELSAAWTQKIDWLRLEFERITTNIILAAAAFALGVYNSIVGKVNELLVIWTQKVDWLRTEFERIAANIILSVILFGINLYNTIVGKINELLAWWSPKWMEFQTQVETIWAQIVGTVTTKILEVYNAIVNKIIEIETWVRGRIIGFIQLGTDIIGGIILGIQNKAAEFLTAFTGLIEGAVNLVKAKLGIGSPSLVFAGFGQDMVSGLGVGVQTTLPVVIAMFDAVTAAGAVVAELLSGILTSAVNVVKASADEFNRVLGGAGGTIEDLKKTSQLARSAMGTIGEPGQAAFFVLRDGAAEAGSAVGGVAAGLDEVHSHSGEVTKIYVFTYHQDIYLPDKNEGGGGGDAGGGGGVGGGGGGCFLGETPILMSDGFTSPIKDVRVGDSILSWDYAARGLLPTPVVGVDVHPPEEVSCWIVVNGSLRVTPEHPMYADDDWRCAGDLQVGDVLMDSEGRESLVTSLEWVDGSEAVYNLHIGHDLHNYFAGGVLVHNAQQKQHGGWTHQGWAMMHSNEFVLSEAMRLGQQAIPALALTPKAMSRLAAVQARNGGAATRGGYAAGSVTNKSVSVEVNPSYQTVESPAGIYYDVMSALTAARA